MKIGLPKEIKDQEGRIALTPDAVRQLVMAKHAVRVELGAGLGAGFGDDEYRAAGASLVGVDEAWDSELVIKVKEPLASEYGHLQRQMLFTFLHLSGAPRSLTAVLLERGTTGIAYETLEDRHGHLPLLAPMSAIAGNMAALVGAYYLGRTHGGKGVQLGQVLGVRHGRVLVIGDGVVAHHAARSAHGLGAGVVLAGLDPAKGQQYRTELGEGFLYVDSTPAAIDRELPETDLVIGAVLRRGARADYVMTREQIQHLRTGSVVVDVSIDQGGCIETSRPTSHSHPVFVEHGIIHYGVTNMPGAYPRTATVALSDAVLPYALRLAQQGLEALAADAGFARALNTHAGYLAIRPVAEDLGLLDRYRPWGSHGA